MKSALTPITVGWVKRSDAHHLGFSARAVDVAGLYPPYQYGFVT